MIPQSLDRPESRLRSIRLRTWPRRRSQPRTTLPEPPNLRLPHPRRRRRHARLHRQPHPRPSRRRAHSSLVRRRRSHPSLATILILRPHPGMAASAHGLPHPRLRPRRRLSHRQPLRRRQPYRIRRRRRPANTSVEPHRHFLLLHARPLRQHRRRVPDSCLRRLWRQWWERRRIFILDSRPAAAAPGWWWW